MTDKPEGYQEHHRQLRRGGDERAVNKLFVSPVLHEWIQTHPEEAGKLGWIVSQYEDPIDVVVTIPDELPAKARKRKQNASTPEERRARKGYSIKTPKDEENVLAEMEDALREHLRPQFPSWTEEVPAYYVWVAAAALALQG